MASNQFTYSQVKDVNEENNDDGANNEDIINEASVEIWMRSIATIFVMETRYECLAVNYVDAPDVKNVVLLLNIRGGMTVRHFVIVFVVDSLIVTDQRPIPEVVVSAVFEYDGFQIRRAGMDIFSLFHLLRRGVAENTEIYVILRG